MSRKRWLIIFACGLAVGYSIVIGRFLQVDYLKLFIIFGLYFLSGFVFSGYFKLISWSSLLFSLPAVFFISYGFYDNIAASITWLVELVVCLLGFISGYFTGIFPRSKKFIPAIVSTIFVAVFALVVNPRIKIATQFKTLKENERIQNNKLVNFSLIKSDGKTITSDELKGKTVLLDFWFIGCAPCYDKMKYLGEVSEYYKNRNDIVVITVDVEQGDKFASFQKTLKRFPSNIIHTFDSAGVLAKELGLAGYPTELILDRFGKIQHQIVGFNKDIALIYTSNTIDKIEKISPSN